MTKDPILLWGLENDSPLAVVHERLVTLGASVFFADQRRVQETAMDLDVGASLSGAIRVGDDSLDLANVAAAYLRPYSSCDLPDVASQGPDSAAWKHAAMVDDLLTCWAEITPAFLVNPFSAMAANHSKPYQLEQIRRQGWSIPETIITTDAEAALAFWERHVDVIYKSVSGVRSQVSRLTPSHRERFADIGACPTQFQQYIRGVDHRVHVAGDEVFASEIICDSDDYRYPGEGNVEIRACSLPKAIEDRCRETSRAAGLPFTGIDLRRASDGEWFCFELNPSPGFTYYESHTNQPIADAVARLLISGAEAAPNYAGYTAAEALNGRTGNSDLRRKCHEEAVTR